MYFFKKNLGIHFAGSSLNWEIPSRGATAHRPGHLLPGQEALREQTPTDQDHQQNATQLHDHRGHLLAGVRPAQAHPLGAILRRAAHRALQNPAQSHTARVGTGHRVALRATGHNEDELCGAIRQLVRLSSEQLSVQVVLGRVEGVLCHRGPGVAEE